MTAELQDRIRATRTVAPDALRERVRAIAAQEAPAAEPSFLARFSPRRFTLVALPVAAALAVVTAGTIGLVRSGEGTTLESQATVAYDAAGKAGATRESAPAVGAPPSAVQPDPARPQRFEGSLMLRVDDVEALSDATKRAMRIARSLGGFVAAVSYDVPEGDRGSATLVLRVPIGRVQAALTQLSALGTILAQHVSLEDLQQQLDELNARVANLEGEIAATEEELRNPGLTARERAQLRSRLVSLRSELEALTGAREQTTQQARLATLNVSLTTEDVAGAPVPQSRLERMLDEAGSILLWELAAVVYALVVVGPLAVVAGAVWLTLRTRRRREEGRLLDES